MSHCLLGPVRLVTPPTALPMTASDCRDQCQLDIHDQDAFVEKLIARATRYVERNIQGQRQLMLATYDLPVSNWWSGQLSLPRPPLSSITSVKYYDSGETQQTLSASYYLSQLAEFQPGTIELAPNYSWPGSLSSRQYPITVRFVAGYASAAYVPETLKHAIAMLVAHWFINREATSERVSNEVAFAVSSLIDSEAWGSYA